MVTKQNIIDHFGAAEVEQVGSKQLFIVTLQNNVTVLISYYTIVGFYSPAADVWYVTDRKYSQTTSCQLTAFARNKRVHKLPEDDFNSQLKLLGVTK